MALAGLVLCVGCESTATEIVVVADSDLRPGSELTAIDARTSGGRHTFEIDGADALPLSFGIVPGPDQRHDGSVQVVLTGLGPDGEPLVEAHAITTFRPGHRLVLPIPLERSCIVVEDCPDRGDQTCRAGTCESAVVDSATLEEGDGSGVRLFEGPSPPDAGGTIDAGPVCEAGSPCEVERGCAVGTRSCGADPECVDLTPAPAGTDCGDGRLCDGEGRCGR